MVSLEYLDLADNSLTGMLPSSFYLTTVSSSLVTLDLRNTNLATNALFSFCNSPLFTDGNFLTEVYADCGNIDDDGAVDPEVMCPCCVGCTNNRDNVTTINLPLVCEISRSHFENERGHEYDETRGSSCSCDETGEVMTCNDSPSCQSCNQDNTVCAVNSNYGWKFDTMGKKIAWRNTLQYVQGDRSDTIEFENVAVDVELGIWECHVSVNGQLCSSCSSLACNDGAEGYGVNCENVPSVQGSFFPCKDNILDGPLAVFALQDPIALNGCPLMLYPKLFGEETD